MESPLPTTVAHLKQPKLSSIQALRGLAACLVLLLHCYSFELRFLQNDGILGAWTIFGNSGVDLFFLISGFIMVYASSVSPSPGLFFLQRLLRIYPLYWFYTAVFLTAIHFFPHLMDTTRIAVGNIFMALFLFPQNAEPPLIVAWTLIHEMYFYFVFTFLLFFPRRMLPSLLAIWTAFVVLADIALGNGVLAASPLWHLVANPLTLEFIFGAALGLYFARTTVKPDSGVSGGLLIFAAPLAAWILHATVFQSTLPSSWGRVCLFGVPWAISLFAIVYIARAQHFVFPRWLISLGDSSYSIYLCHCLVLGVVYRAIREIRPYGIEGATLGMFAFVVGVLAVLQFGVISYRLLEQPVNRALRTLTKQSVTIPPLRTRHI